MVGAGSRRERARARLRGAAVALAGLLWLPPPAAARTWPTAWRSEEAGRTAEGCNRSGDILLCLAVRCDAPGRIGLHFSVVEGDPFPGRFGVRIDGRTFPLAVAGPGPYPWGYGWQARALPAGLPQALARGSTLTLRGADVSAGFDTFALAAGRTAIRRVLGACRAKAAGGPAPRASGPGINADFRTRAQAAPS